MLVSIQIKHQIILQNNFPNVTNQFKPRIHSLNYNQYRSHSGLGKNNSLIDYDQCKINQLKNFQRYSFLYNVRTFGGIFRFVSLIGVVPSDLQKSSLPEPENEKLHQ